MAKTVRYITSSGFKNADEDLKNEINKAWAKSPQKKSGKKKSDFVYSPEKGEFIKNSEAVKIQANYNKSKFKKAVEQGRKKLEYRKQVARNRKYNYSMLSDAEKGEVDEKKYNEAVRNVENGIEQLRRLYDELGKDYNDYLSDEMESLTGLRAILNDTTDEFKTAKDNISDSPTEAEFRVTMLEATRTIETQIMTQIDELIGIAQAEIRNSQEKE